MSIIQHETEYVDGDAKHIVIDGEFSLDELKEIIKELEAGNTFEWQVSSEDNHIFGSFET